MELDVAQVRRLTRATPAWRRAVGLGLDVDDLMQAVFVGLLTKQQGASAFNPERSSWSHYVWLVASSLISHEIDKTTNRRGLEGLGHLASHHDHIHTPIVDVAQWASETQPAAEADKQGAIAIEIADSIGERDIAAMLLEGHSVRDIKRRLPPARRAVVDSVAEQVRARLTLRATSRAIGEVVRVDREGGGGK